MSGSLLARSCGGRLLTWATSWHHFFLFAWTGPFLSGSLIFFQSLAAGPTPGPGPSFAVVINPTPPKMNLSTEFILFFCVGKAKSCSRCDLWRHFGSLGTIVLTGNMSGPSKQPRPAPWKDDPPPFRKRTHTFQSCASSPSPANNP